MPTDPTPEAMAAAKRIEKAAPFAMLEYRKRYREEYARIIGEEFAAVRRERDELHSILQAFVAHYPYGVNPDLNEAYARARNALNGAGPCPTWMREAARLIAGDMECPDGAKFPCPTCERNVATRIATAYAAREQGGEAIEALRLCASDSATLSTLTAPAPPAGENQHVP